MQGLEKGKGPEGPILDGTVFRLARFSYLHFTWNLNLYGRGSKPVLHSLSDFLSTRSIALLIMIDQPQGGIFVHWHVGYPTGEEFS